MAETKVQVALDNLKNTVESDSYEEAQKTYENWSDTYDTDLNILGSQTHVQTGLMALNYLKEGDVVLDIGAGTGRVEEILRKHHFNGVIDALDANLEMLFVGEKKQLKYRNIIRHYVDENGTLPLRDRMYDVVISSGAFLPNHIPVTALKGIINAVKRNGILIITMRRDSIEEYKAQFDQVVEELEKSGKIILLEAKEFSHYTDSAKKLVSVCQFMKVL